MPEFSDQSLLKQRQQLREMAQGFQQAQILLPRVELGMFEALKDDQATAFILSAIERRDKCAKPLFSWMTKK